MAVSLDASNGKAFVRGAKAQLALGNLTEAAEMAQQVRAARLRLPCRGAAARAA